MGLQPFDPIAILTIGLLNPLVPLIAVLMGRAADQWQKVIVAAFAAAFAGAIVIWIVTYFRLLPAKGIGGEAGLFLVHFAIGLVWAALGYVLLRPGARRR
jgi:hypothetical protein